MLNFELGDLTDYLHDEVRRAKAAGQKHPGSGAMHLNWVMGPDGEPKLATIGLYQVKRDGRPIVKWAPIPLDLRMNPDDPGDSGRIGQTALGTEPGEWYRWEKGKGFVKQDGPIPADARPIPADPDPTKPAPAWIPADKTEYTTRMFHDFLAGSLRPGTSPFWPAGRPEAFTYEEYLESIKTAPPASGPVAVKDALVKSLEDLLAVARAL